MAKFSEGQKLKCVDAGTGHQLSVGLVYTVHQVDNYNDRVYVKNSYGDKLHSSFGFARFKALEATKPSAMSFKAGGVVRVKKNANTIHSPFSFVLPMEKYLGKEITLTDSYPGPLRAQGWAWDPKWLEPMVSTLENLSVGDEIVTRGGLTYTVEAVIGNVVISSNPLTGVSMDTVNGLKGSGVTVKQPIKEVTKAEIAKLLDTTEDRLVIK